MREISEIAREVRATWAKPNYAAVPYLGAMEHLTDIRDNFFADSGRSVVSYFLANADTYRGDAAKRIKAELKAMLRA